MSRLTTHQYLSRAQFVWTVWCQQRHHFTKLSASAQWDLHDYFAPSVDLTNERLLAHRTAMTQRFPSLPQQAGRAYAQLERAVTTSRPQPGALTVGSVHKGKRLIISAEVRPKIDAKKLTRVVQMLATEIETEARVARENDRYSR